MSNWNKYLIKTGMILYKDTKTLITSFLIDIIYKHSKLVQL